MNRLISVVLVFALAVAMTACDGSDAVTGQQVTNPDVPVVTAEPAWILQANPGPGATLKVGDPILTDVVFQFPEEVYPAWFFNALVRDDGSDGVVFYYGDATYQDWYSGKDGVNPSRGKHVGTYPDHPYRVNEHLVNFAGDRTLNLIFVAGKPNLSAAEDFEVQLGQHVFRLKPEGIAYTKVFPLDWTIQR